MKASLLLPLYTFSRVIAEHHPDHIPVPKINEIKDLSDDLLKNYSKHVLPFEGPWQFVIDIYVYLVAVGDIDELHEKLSTVMRLEYEWRDKSFRWNHLEQNITYVTFGWQDVCKPVLRVTNPHADSINRHNVRSQDSVIYDSTGWAFFDEMMVTRTKCSLDMSFYLFDIQICAIKLGIVRDSKFHFKLNVYLEDLISNSDAEHTSWKLTKISKSSLYGTFEIVMKFERRPLFILLHILLPIIVLALLTPTVFLLTKKTGDRIGFSMTMLLALSIYMTLASNHLKSNAEPMPFILIMLFLWYTMDSVIIFVVIISARIYRFKNERPRPDCVRRFVLITQK